MASRSSDLATLESDRRLFTPINAETGERVRLHVSPGDLANVRRGSWRALVRDLDSGKRWQAWGADCSIAGCRCDAMAVQLLETARPPVDRIAFAIWQAGAALAIPRKRGAPKQTIEGALHLVASGVASHLAEAFPDLDRAEFMKGAGFRP